MKINGRKIAQEILEDLKSKVQSLNITPALAIILIGNDPASIVYIEQKDLKAEEIGAKTAIINLESGIQSSELKAIIEKLNTDPTIQGIIVQRPLPPHINSEDLSLTINPQKDVDGFHPNSKFEPPIFMAVIAILRQINIDPQNKNIVIFGKGEAGGKPIIEGFNKLNIKPIVIDSKTPNPQNLTKNADIVISAVGKSNIIKPDIIKQGVILISVGLHKGSDGKLHGDYDEEAVRDIASFYTPTPGGVGPLNVSMLMKNLVVSAEKVPHKLDR